MSQLVVTILREIRLYWRSPSDVLNPLVFFAVVITLFPLGLGPDDEFLSVAAPGVIWVALLLATLMSIDAMFKGDFEDGTLEQIVAGDSSVLIFVVGKVVAHWLVTAMPMLIMIPVAALTLFVDGRGMIAMIVALLLVSPTLSLLGSIGAALTVGLARGGLLITILVLPLYVPVLILGTAMVQAGVSGMDTTGYAYWLAAIALLALGLAPVATTAAVNLAVER